MKDWSPRIIDWRGRPPLRKAPKIVKTPGETIRQKARATQRTNTPQSERQLSFNAAQGAIPVGYGWIKSAVGFVLRPKVVGGFLYTAGVHGEGEIDSIVSTTIDGRLPSELTGSTVTAYTGTSGQTANAMLTGIEPLWTTPLADIAYLALKLPIPNQTTGEYDLTRVESIWKGKKIYDPRSALTVWSDNPALIWADLARNTRYGGCIPDAKIDWDSVAEAADDCDEEIAEGPAAPSTALTAVRLATGGDLSTTFYTYTYTNVDTDGFESAESPASTPTSVSRNDRMTLTAIAVGGAGTTGRRIYRTRKDGLTPRHFVAAIADNTTTTYTDGVADAALGGTPNVGPYKRYTLDLFVQNVAPWPEWDATIRAHFACMKIFNSGKWKLIVDKAKSVSGVTFTDDPDDPLRNLIGFPTLRVKGARERPELVTVSYIDRFNDYSPGSVSEPESPPAAPKVEERFDFQGIPGHQAIRLAKYLYNLQLRDREYSMRTMQRGALPLPGAIVEVTSQRGPLVAEKMLLLNSEPDGIAWKHQLENYDPDVYGDVVVTDVPPVVTPPPDPLETPPNVTGLTAPTDTEAHVGTVYWTEITTFANLAGYEVYDYFGAPAVPNLIPPMIPRDSVPTLAQPLDLKPYIRTLPDGSRKFAILVKSISTTGRRSSGVPVSWTLGGLTDPGTDPHDSPVYASAADALSKEITDTVATIAEVWDPVHDAVAADTNESTLLLYDSTDFLGGGNKRAKISRGFLEFVLDGLPTDTTVTAASLEVYITNETSGFLPSVRSMTVHAVGSAAGDSPFDLTDFDQAGGTSWGSAPMPEGPGYVAIPLNGTGVAAVQAALAGTLKMALRTDNDITDAPTDADTQNSQHAVEFDETIGEANGPRLVVTFGSGSTDVNDPPDGTPAINRYEEIQDTPQAGNAAIDGEFRAATFEGLLPIQWTEQPIGPYDGIEAVYASRYVILDGSIIRLPGANLTPGEDYNLTGPQEITFEPHAIPGPTDEGELLITYNRSRAVPSQFVDDLGNVYDSAGEFVSSGGPTADTDSAYGYSISGDDDKIGAAGSYDTLIIGSQLDDSGYQGPSDHTNRTTLKLGIGASSGILCGLEQKNSGGGSSDSDWTVVLRDISDFSIITTNAAAFITAWIAANTATYPGDEIDYQFHVSADPEGGSFWINVIAQADPPPRLPMWNISAADGSEIFRIDVDHQSQFVRRLERILP